MIGKLARFSLRAVWIQFELVYIAATYYILVLRLRREPSPAEKARWLQRSCRRFLRTLGTSAHFTGPLPREGLLVSNHLGYLDILTLSSITPAIFISKHEVASWPVFGWYARKAGTIFVRRARRTEAASSGNEIREALDAGHLVVLFPEGTSSDGRQVLPFKSALLEPVSNDTHALHISAIAYELEDGSAETDVCYWGEMTLLPHLFKLMTKKRITARVRFAAVNRTTTDRKQLARQLHAEISELKGLTGTMPPRSPASRDQSTQIAR